MVTQTSVAPHKSPVGLARLAWAVTAYNVAVILWGAAVRATHSGAGCGEHWPLCNGTLVQHHPAISTLIELVHRASSGIALFAIIGLLVWVFRSTPVRHLARFAVVASLVLTLNEALLGALLVLLGKVANDRSPSRGVYLGLHLTNTLLLLAALTLTAHFAGRRRGYMRGSVELRSIGIAITGWVALLVVGVSGSLAALADTLYPPGSLRSSMMQDFSAQAPWLVRLRWLHPAFSLLAGAYLCWLIWRSLRMAEERPLASAVIVLLGLQYVLGVADIVLLTPTWLQMAHLLGADMLWMAVVVLTARLCVYPIGCPNQGAEKVCTL